MMKTKKMLLAPTLERVRLIGRDSLLNPKIALFCSNKCTGTAILKTFQFCRSIGRTGYVVMGGFQSRIERACLDILLDSKSPIAACPGRHVIESRLPRRWREAISHGYMLVVCPFSESQGRVTSDLALARNLLLTRMADSVLIAHAHPGGKTEALCKQVLGTGKRVYTFNDSANQHLIELGAIPIDPDFFSKRGLQVGTPESLRADR